MQEIMLNSIKKYTSVIALVGCCTQLNADRLKRETLNQYKLSDNIPAKQFVGYETDIPVPFQGQNLPRFLVECFYIMADAKKSSHKETTVAFFKAAVAKELGSLNEVAFPGLLQGLLSSLQFSIEGASEDDDEIDLSAITRSYDNFIYELLVAQSTCTQCGMSGHDSTTCPHKH